VGINQPRYHYVFFILSTMSVTPRFSVCRYVFIVYTRSFQVFGCCS